MNRLRIKTLAGRIGGTPQVEYRDPGSTEDGAGSPCNKQNCTTTYTGPMGVECCCAYVCPSGVTWVCRQGSYCAA